MFPALVILLILVAFLSPPARAYSGALLSYPLENPVTIDGKWTTDREWSDAYQDLFAPAIGYRAGSGHEKVPVDIRICLKHDESKLYILVDFISDPRVNFGSNNPDSAWFYLDTLGNGGSKLQEDDVVAMIFWERINSSDVAVLHFLKYGTGESRVGCRRSMDG